MDGVEGVRTVFLDAETSLGKWHSSLEVDKWQAQNLYAVVSVFRVVIKSASWQSIKCITFEKVIIT